MKLKTLIHKLYLLLSLLTILFASCQRDKKTISKDYSFFTSDGIKLVGSLKRPISEKKSPLIILIHGSGNDSRENEYYKLLTKEFCNIGYAVFSYDKRGCNASTGSWLSVPFSYLKDDVLTIVMEFSKDSTFTKIGLWGGSEGSNIAIWAAAESKDIDFVIAQSFTPMTFAEQNKFVKQTRINNYPNTSKQKIKELMDLQDLLYEYVRTGNGYDKYIAAFNNLRNEPWFSDILNEPVTENGQWSKWYKTKLDIESSKFIDSISIPVLFVWGQNDVLIDVQRSVNILKLAKQNANIKIFENANHSLYAGGRKPVHLQFIKDWLSDLYKN